MTQHGRDVERDPVLGIPRPAELAGREAIAGGIGPRKRDAAFPWLVALAVAVPVAALTKGVEQGTAIGVSSALVLGAIFASVVAGRQARRYANAARSMEQRHELESEDRATALRRQFEWSVDDLALTRKRLKTADLRRADAERAAEDLRELVTAQEREIRRSRQRLFEIAAVDLSELRDARDEANRRRDEGQVQVARAVADARRFERQLREARERIDELTAALASVAAAAGATTKRRGDPQRSHAAGIDRSASAAWSVEGDVLTVDGVGVYSIVSAIRVRDDDGTVVARMPAARDGDTGVVRVRMAATVASLVRGGSLKLDVLIDERWSAVPPRASADRRDRSSGRPKHLRVVGD